MRALRAPAGVQYRWPTPRSRRQRVRDRNNQIRRITAFTFREGRTYDETFGESCDSGGARLHIWRTAMIKRNSRQAVRAAVDTLESRVLFATVVALTSTDQLVTFDSSTPATTSTPVGVTGLASSETLLGIDFRPATGQLFGLGSTGQLYRINRTSGAATAVGAPLTVTGTSFGFDFNPAVDRIRV